MERHKAAKQIDEVFPRHSPPLIQIRVNSGDMCSCALHKDPFPRTSAIRLEQLRESEGPPPLEVPRKVTSIGCDLGGRDRICSVCKPAVNKRRVRWKANVCNNMGKRPSRGTSGLKLLYLAGMWQLYTICLHVTMLGSFG